MACVGVVVGDWMVDELPEELLELLGLLLGVLEELLCLADELVDLADELDVPELDVPELDDPELDAALLLDDVPEDFTAAWVEPGRMASTTPATPTLARDTVIVVVFRRRLPRSRSATARASCLLFIPTSLARPAVKPV